MTGQSQLISFYKHSSSDLIQGDSAVASIPVHLWNCVTGMKMEDSTFEGQSLSCLQKCLFAHLY